MVGVSGQKLLGPVDLLGQHRPGQQVWPGHGAEGQGQARFLQQTLAMAVRPADQEGPALFIVIFVELAMGYLSIPGGYCFVQALHQGRQHAAAGFSGGHGAVFLGVKDTQFFGYFQSMVYWNEVVITKDLLDIHFFNDELTALCLCQKSIDLF